MGIGARQFLSRSFHCSRLIVAALAGLGVGSAVGGITGGLVGLHSEFGSQALEVRDERWIRFRPLR